MLGGVGGDGFYAELEFGGDVSKVDEDVESSRGGHVGVHQWEGVCKSVSCPGIY